MKRLRLCFLVPLSIFCCQAFAQVEDLMRDKNITWIAESYNDFLTESIRVEKIGKTMSRVTPLKFLNTNEETVPEGFILQRLILEAVRDNKLLIYADTDCKISTNYGNLIVRDTIVIPNSNSYEVVTKLCNNNPSAQQILFFRARQILYYDSMKVQFGLRTIAIAPMMKETNESGEIINWKPMFWIKATDLMNKRRLSDTSITWASRMMLHNGFALRSDSTKILKQMGDNEPLSSLFEAFTTKPSIPFYKTDIIEPMEKYTFSERAELFSGMDTIEIINTLTYETKVKVQSRAVNIKEIKSLILIQNWYWDDEKKQLQIRLVATAPLIKYKDDGSEPQYSGSFGQPLFFYRRTDD